MIEKYLSLHKTIAFIFFLAVISCRNNSSPDTAEHIGLNSFDVPLINYSVVNVFPHDTSLFTEGFVFHDGKFFESSGAPNDIPYTNSVVGSEDLQTGSFDKKITIDKTKYFGEGITFLGNKFYQLTWLNHLGFIYDAKSFKQIGTFSFPNEGWGLATDGKYLIMDDSSNHLTYLHPGTYKPVKILSVTRNGMAQDSLNELEFIKGYIYANVWYRNEIVKIDTSTGKIVGKLDLSSIVNDAERNHPGSDVLNGIAYDSVQDKIYVTGKLWPKIYQINFPH
ncbi:glutaminyl-peptide cyclotransferase [Arachidicoccus soli]|uniref:Glutaminyl-peptide cyclotransferase n=1 Tax=Arachidicoccus soli TaxID=2341117 RepID=A0A386HSM5_9BACT|nr:glutaminyl-peptide cyclotransferase [Arachidicoccus soli]AYD48506.1 glutaminyl-peptide cyclotransferase [Arachidicoccus soli]